MEIWPDNLAAVNVFLAMTTQWRSTGFGATGLDYSVLDFVMQRSGVQADDKDDVFESIRILEDAALAQMKLVADREREQAKRRHG